MGVGKFLITAFHSNSEHFFACMHLKKQSRCQTTLSTVGDNNGARYNNWALAFRSLATTLG